MEKFYYLEIHLENQCYVIKYLTPDFEIDFIKFHRSIPYDFVFTCFNAMNVDLAKRYVDKFHACVVK